MAVVLPTVDFPSDITEVLLKAHVGQTVEDFCSMFGKKGDVHNHCAHWVSHALGFRIGKLCNAMTWDHRKNAEAGRSLNVDSLFNQCPERGYWKDRPSDLTSCLMFAILPHGIGTAKGSKTLTMSAIPNKHVGICFGGQVYNYHNKTGEGVHADPTDFFDTLYGKKTVVLYGTFPK